MSRGFFFRCGSCSKQYDWDTLEFHCECRGLFQVEFQETFDPRLIDLQTPSLLRYAHAFPSVIQEHMAAISFGEGWTAIVRRSAAEPNALVKMDHLMPTMSFKDRGAVVLVALARAIGVDRIVQDSSGNAGHAVATYAARAGIPCEIFVPAVTSPKKIAMIEATGAKANLIPGSREDTADATLQAASEPSTFYASHVYNPLFYEGTRTYVFEILEQLGRLPSRFVVPLGNGTLVLGVARALDELSAEGVVTDCTSRIVAVQADNCAPVFEAFRSDRSEVPAVKNLGTSAEGIAIARPMRGDEALAAIRSTQGEVWISRESELKTTQTKMARMGFDIEPTTAATFAAFDANSKDADDLVVLPICGSGAKK